MPVPQRTRQAYLLPRGTNDYGPRSQPERLPYSFELHYLLKDLGAKYEVIWMNYFGQIMMIVPRPNSFSFRDLGLELGPPSATGLMSGSGLSREHKARCPWMSSTTRIHK